jgi:hypothetical protein
MSARLVAITSSPAPGQHRAIAPRPDDEPAPIDASTRARLVAACGTATAGWHAPERAARDTAEAIGLASEEAPALAAWWGPDHGEPLDALLARTGTWLDTVDLSQRRGVVVASPPVVRALVVQALGAPASVFWRLDVAVLSVSVLTRAEDTWRVRSIGDR